MIAGLHGFMDALRAAGLRVSPAEILDALRALQGIELDRKEPVRAALASCLVKRQSLRPTFDSVFDSYFVVSAIGTNGRPGKRGRAAVSGSGDVVGIRGGRNSSPGPSHSSRRAPGVETPSCDRRLVLGASSSSEPVARLDSVVQPNPAADPERTVKPDPSNRGSTLMRPLPDANDGAENDARELLKRLRRGETLTGPLPGRLRRVVRTGPRSAREGVEQLRHRSLRGRMSVDEETEILEELPRYLELLRHRPSRRQRRSRRGPIYLRNLFRANASYGGVPWLLPRRSRRRRPPKLVLLLDVSWSVARASGLFLQLAENLIDRLPDVRILMFVDRPVDVTDRLKFWLGAHPVTAEAPRMRGPIRPGAGIVRNGLAFADFVESMQGLSPTAPSDYGRAFHALADGFRIDGRNTVLLILGDGRNNRFATQAFALEDVRERCRSIVWLVPEPVQQWGVADSALEAYLPFVDVLVESGDLEGLVRGFDELGKRVGL